MGHLKVDDDGFNIGVFDNRMRPFAYNQPVQTHYGHSGLKRDETRGWVRTDTEQGRKGEPRERRPQPERFLPEEQRAEQLYKEKMRQRTPPEQQGAAVAAAH